MTKVDQFESVFRAASRTVFTPENVKVGSVLVVSDREVSAADDFGARARGFLEVLDQTENIRWRVIHGGRVPDGARSDGAGGRRASRSHLHVPASALQELALVLILLTVIPREEPDLLQHLPEEYASYRHSTGGLFPRSIRGAI